MSCDQSGPFKVLMEILNMGLTLLQNNPAHPIYPEKENSHNKLGAYYVIIINCKHVYTAIWILFCPLLVPEF